MTPNRAANFAWLSLRTNRAALISSAVGISRDYADRIAFVNALRIVSYADCESMEAHERLQWARKQAGFDEATDAARAMGISPPTYLGHENGSRGFISMAARYARFFKVDFEWLATGRGDPKRGYRTRAHELLEDLPEPARAEAERFLEFLHSKHAR